MEIQGLITSVRVYDEEGRTDWLLAVSKIVWFLTWVLIPLSIFRFVYDLFGIIDATIISLVLLILLRMVGPHNLVMLDELMSRIAPSLRSAVRHGVVRVYDFRIRTDAGREVACVLRGNLVGASPIRGDRLRLRGIMQHGTLQVERGWNAASGAILAPRSSRSLLVLMITLAVAAVFSLYLAGLLDPWIYPLVVSFFDWMDGLQ